MASVTATLAASVLRSGVAPAKAHLRRSLGRRRHALSIRHQHKPLSGR